MRRAPHRGYKIVGAFDTETTNMTNRRAFTHLYTLNIIHDLQTYEEPDVTLYRSPMAMMGALDDIIEAFNGTGFTPIITAYNLMFDLVTLMPLIRSEYAVSVTAKSGTNVYTLDVMTVEDEPRCVLRFWDTFWLDTNGLASMGRTCGLPKAVGDWDYDAIRTPGTPLTEEERGYAIRDVEVIPAYLKWMLGAYPFLKESDLGVTVLTKTSIVRTYAKRVIGKRLIPTSTRKKQTTEKAFIGMCNREQPKTYDIMALRQSCFRGGLAFTAANYAGEVVRNVKSLDAVSMHHAHINGHYVPEKFREASIGVITSIAKSVTKMSVDDVLAYYAKPFAGAFHASIQFDGITLKDGTAFSTYGIGVLAMDKFRKAAAYYDREDQGGENEATNVSIESIRENGFIDVAVSPVFAYGKLMSAKRIIVNVTELELFVMAQVYTWNDMKVIRGELSTSFTRPPDYITLQSNALFEMKTAAKHLVATYDGEPYGEPVPDCVPETVRGGVTSGTLTKDWVHAWYVSTVKGMFNGIFGTQAQNEFKPDYIVTDEGIKVDREHITTVDNYQRKRGGHVLYTYGIRIAGWSRVHLVIAITLLFNAFGDRIIITGGDTDSIKMSVTDDITDDDIMRALKPLHDATDEAIRNVMERVRRGYPDIASTLSEVGHFELEDCGGSDHYVAHMEAWNKARASMGTDGRVHVTCAGLPQPAGSYTLSDWLTDVCEGSVEKFERYAPIALGYNTIIAHGVCHCLETSRPQPGSMIDEDVTDYRGETTRVRTPEAVCVYPYDKKLGDTTQLTNLLNVTYLKALGKTVDIIPHVIDVDERGPFVLWMNNMKEERPK